MPTQQQRRAAKKKRIEARERFRRAHLAEKAFARKLKQVAKQVGEITKKFSPGGVLKSPTGLEHALRKYSGMIKPWAESVSRSLIADISRRDFRAWGDLGEEIGRSLQAEIRSAPTGRAMKAILNEQVDLITSLPTQAAQRVHKLTVEGMTSGTRAKETAKEILRTGKVTAARAMLIARTETTRTVTAIVEARSKFIGSEGYIWRTAEDSDVRERHKHLEGKFIAWNKPPVAGESGERYHAGAGPNCRCYPEPVIPDVL